MKLLTKSRNIRFTEQQNKAFEALESYNVNVSKFIRLAVSEKIKRDWKTIKERKERIKLPF